MWRRFRTRPIIEQLAEFEPVMAHLFSLHPWDLLELTNGQWSRFREYAEANAEGR